jgi:8-oxo-dGTP pyrophosphatase MutT (NUDIX family)
MNAREKMIYQLLGQMVHVEVDRPIGYCHGDIVYPINYGYIPGIIAGDGEEQDAYILGVDTPVASFDGQVVAVIRRRNDAEDKLVVAPKGTVYHQGQIAQATHFQEQFFDTTIDSLFRKSCGVLPYRVLDRQREYLLVFEHYSQCWSLPKGHMEAGESETETALRELFEETGLTGTLDSRHFVTVEYPVSVLSRKQVVIFPGQVNGTLRAREGEIEDLRWVKAEDLPKLLFPDMAEACVRLIAAMDNMES